MTWACTLTSTTCTRKSRQVSTAQVASHCPGACPEHPFPKTPLFFHVLLLHDLLPYWVDISSAATLVILWAGYSLTYVVATWSLCCVKYPEKGLVAPAQAPSWKSRGYASLLRSCKTFLMSSSGSQLHFSTLQAHELSTFDM